LKIIITPLFEYLGVKNFHKSSNFWP